MSLDHRDMAGAIPKLYPEIPQEVKRDHEKDSERDHEKDHERELPKEKSRFINDLKLLSVFDCRLVLGITSLMISIINKNTFDITNSYFQMGIVTSFMLFCIWCLCNCKMSRTPMMYSISGALIGFFLLFPLIGKLVLLLNCVMIIIDVVQFALKEMKFIPPENAVTSIGTNIRQQRHSQFVSLGRTNPSPPPYGQYGGYPPKATSSAGETTKKKKSKWW